MRKGSSKYTEEFVKEYLSKFGYSLLSKYKNISTKVKIKCPNEHIIYQIFDSFKRGRRCSICAYEKIGDDSREKFENIKSFIGSRGYICLSSKVDYKNNYSYVKLKCQNNHIFTMRYDGFKAGANCPICVGNKKIKFEEIQKYINSFGYKCSGVYKNTGSKLKFICPEGHEYVTRVSIFREGGRCPICRYISHSIIFSGKNNPSWRGGISYEPYCEIWTDQEYKESIKQRDGYKCLNPECNKILDRLSVHHINYNKKNCHPSNLITICISCNSKANKDRKWHEAWYKAILYRRYNIV